MSLFFAIDLGTTKCTVSTFHNGKIITIPDEHGNLSFDSVVSFLNVPPYRYVGQTAKNQMNLNLKNTFYETKRLIGRKYTDPDIEETKKLLSYELFYDADNNILLGNDKLTCIEIASEFLKKAKKMASDYYGEEVKNCIVTVPTLFNDLQRTAVLLSCKIADVNCIRLLEEPIATCLAYGFLNMPKYAKNILVYDLGGSTLDISLVEIENNTFNVLCSGGNKFLGGKEFDERIMSYCLNKFSIDKGDLKNISLQNLKYECEKAKKRLSTVLKTHIYVSNFKDNKDLSIMLTRDDMELICGDLFYACIHPIDKILEDLEMTIENIDHIVLVGGATKMLKLRELLNLKFKKIDVSFTVDPDLSISHGASVQGKILLYPDTEDNNITLLNKTPFSLGVETFGGFMEPIINKNTYIPCESSKMFSSDTDFAKSVVIKVFEGNSKLTKYNTLIGEFELHNIEQALRGVPEITVTFSIDENGILSVSAMDKFTLEEANILVTTNKGVMNDYDLDELIQKSRRYDELDKIEYENKKLHFDIDECCTNILLNVKYYNIPNIDISDILIWLKDEHTTEEYKNKLQEIQNKYNLLITRMKHKNVEPDDNSQNGCTVYGEEEEEQKNFYILEKEKEKNDIEIRSLKNDIISLCTTIQNYIITNCNEDEKYKELKDYINDCRIIIYSLKPDLEFLQNQLNELNQKYLNIIEKPIESIKSQLENLCYSVLVYDENNQIANETLGWVEDRYDDDYALQKLNELQLVFDNIEKGNIELNTDNNDGLSIMELIQNNVNNLLNK